MKLNVIAILALCLLASCGIKSDNRMTEDQFNQLLDESSAYLNEKIEWCKSEYNIGTYERYDWNQETGELIWSDAGIPKIVAKIQFVGSVSKKSNTWLWSWANPTILDDVKKDILSVKAFGEKHQIERLTTAKWLAEEVDGWEMTSIAAKLCGAKGAYRSPDGDGFTFLIITDISWAKNEEEHPTR